MKQKLEEKNDNTILDMIIEGVNIIRTQRREVKEIILGTESVTELQMNTLDMIYDIYYDGEEANMMGMKLLGYPIKILSFLPHNYIGLRL